MKGSAIPLLRAVKNRFGSTNEIGVFEMGEKGLQSYNDPSMFFLSQRPENVPGSAVTCIMQGSRPMLLEVQALVATSNFGNPRRLGSGFDYNRLLLILAVLERKLGLSLGNKDVYINIAGGMKIDDPGADLAVAAAIVSSMKEIALEERLLVIGEVGLLGEVRSIGQMARRLKEGEGFGFKTAVVPKSCEEKSKELRLIKAVDMTQALSFLGLI
ncbi:MAG: magnesium chelatase domain-containing protein [Clostridiales bacterium]